jgi:hypothetical protein
MIMESLKLIAGEMILLKSLSRTLDLAARWLKSDAHLFMFRRVVKGSGLVKCD